MKRETEAYAERAGSPMPGAYRRLLARSVILRFVRSHAENLTHLGELWTVDREHAYASALEDAIFGYGCLQPLFELPDVENIEIHGYDSVVVHYATATARSCRGWPTAMRNWSRRSGSWGSR